MKKQTVKQLDETTKKGRRDYLKFKTFNMKFRDSGERVRE